MASRRSDPQRDALVIRSFVGNAESSLTKPPKIGEFQWPLTYKEFFI